MPPKFYYFIEDLDITSDNIPDGILVRQCKININKQQINYIRNSYISDDKLQSMISSSITNTANKPILLSNKVINEIKNNKLDFARLPRVIISKKSHFAHLLHKKQINIIKFIRELNNIFS